MINTLTEITLGEGDIIARVDGVTMTLGRAKNEIGGVSPKDPQIVLRFTDSDVVDAFIGHLQFLRSNYVKTSVNVD